MIHKIIKGKQISRNMYSADIQVYIKSTGYSQSILICMERNLIWFRGSGDFFLLMQNNSTFLKVRKSQYGWKVMS